MIKINQVANGVAAFVEAKIFPSLTLTSRTMAIAALTYARLKPINALNFVSMAAMPNATPDNIMRSAEALNLIDNEYNVDVDTLIEIAKETARKCGKLEIKLYGFGVALEESHFELLKTFIEKAE